MYELKIFFGANKKLFEIKQHNLDKNIIFLS